MTYYTTHQDGHIYPAREMIEALEEIIQKDNMLGERFSFRISNGLQV